MFSEEKIDDHEQVISMVQFTILFRRYDRKINLSTQMHLYDSCICFQSQTVFE